MVGSGFDLDRLTDDADSWQAVISRRPNRIGFCLLSSFVFSNSSEQRPMGHLSSLGGIQTDAAPVSGGGLRSSVFPFPHSQKKIYIYISFNCHLVLFPSAI